MTLTPPFAFILLAATTLPAHAAGTLPWIELHGHRIDVEIADNDASRDQGLMFRTALAPGHGMLFIFDDSEVQTFWMKNTLIPLDMLFFDADRKLVSIQHRVPPCHADPCPVYPSTGPAMYVLELAAGTSRRIGVRGGSVLDIQGSYGKVR